MATRNTIELLKLRETERSNRAKEGLSAQEVAIKAKEAQIKADQLAETIRDNLRNYGINIQKNQITKLANDQLNDREANKLLETIRSNLKNEELKLRAQIETERSNKERERLEQELNDIKRMDTLLTASKASGKTPFALLTSWFLNQANIQAFAGTNSFNEYAKQIHDWLSDGDAVLSDVNKQPGSKRYSPAIEGVSVQNNPVTFKRYNYERNAKRGNKKSIQDYKNAYLEERAFKEWNQTGYGDIPTDLSNSKGPGGNNYENVTKTTSFVQEGRIGHNPPISESNNVSEPSRNESSNIIYSPGAKASSSYGPGIAFK